MSDEPVLSLRALDYIVLWLEHEILDMEDRDTEADPEFIGELKRALAWLQSGEIVS
jgi:hypothetical protein